MTLTGRVETVYVSSTDRLETATSRCSFAALVIEIDNYAKHANELRAVSYVSVSHGEITRSQSHSHSVAVCGVNQHQTMRGESYFALKDNGRVVNSS